jgi:pimeloyl-ACP methyl ester carboxylesterase
VTGRLGRRGLGLVGGLVGGLAGIGALNRVAVHRIRRRPDPVDPAGLALPGDRREHRLTMSDGCVLRAVERGPRDGPPVLLLHGVTLAASVWAYQMRGVADAGRRVVALDLRGHGGSGGAPGGGSRRAMGAAPTLERMALDVGEVLSGLDLGGATLVGHSMGGMVTLRLLGLRPDLAAGSGPVAALVLVATAANATRDRGIPGLSDALALAAPLIGPASGLAARLPGPTLPASDLAFLLARVTFGSQASHRQVAFTGHLTSEVPVRVSAGLLLDILRFDAEAVLSTIRLPTSVVVGDHDLMTPPGQAEHMAGSIAGAELFVLEGCGHMVMLERPDELNRLVLERSGR